MCLKLTWFFVFVGSVSQISQIFVRYATNIGRHDKRERGECHCVAEIEQIGTNYTNNVFEHELDELTQIMLGRRKGLTCVNLL